MSLKFEQRNMACSNMEYFETKELYKNAYLEKGRLHDMIVK